MTQEERRIFLLNYLIKEKSYDIPLPKTEQEQKYLLRSLLNIREALPISDEFILVQDEYLKTEIKNAGITDIVDLKAEKTRGNGDFFIWKGDITTLKVGAIVNAANSELTGCYQPCHSCIDNCIHTYSGVQLRSVCDKIIKKQGTPEATGKAKITPAFNLPCDYVIHTVGPIISGPLTKKDRELLASCYKSCLESAKEYSVKSIAFCCISTGVFCFPPLEAAKIAVSTVEQWKEKTKSDMKVVFNVFSEKDESIYKSIFEEL